MSPASAATVARSLIAVGVLVFALAVTGCASQAMPAAVQHPAPGPSSGSPTPAPTEPATVPSPTPAAEGTCDPAQLTTTVEQRGMDSGAGHFYWNLVFTNSSESDCALEGTPTVQLGSAATGDPVGNPGEPTVVEGAGMVSLPPGASAYSLISLTQAGAYGCPLVPVDSLIVTLPHGEGPAVPVATPNDIEGCDDTTHTLFTVGSLTPTPFQP